MILIRFTAMPKRLEKELQEKYFWQLTVEQI